MLAISMSVSTATAQEPDEDAIEEVVVVGNLGSLPDEEVPTVFGFGKSRSILLELQPSATK